MNYNVNKVREDFPILSTKIYNKNLIYLDNGATTQKPNVVIDCVNSYHTSRNSSIHRGIHYLSEQATSDYEESRITVQKFINARHSHEVIFTSGSTGSINGFAFSFGERYINEGDEIIISEMEHHANIVPWQMLCERKKSKLKIIPFNDDGILDLEVFRSLLSERTKLVSIIHVSNTLGTINPVNEIIKLAHKINVPVMIDAAQSVQHITIDVQSMDCDFLVFSGHKIYGPTGIGVLYGKEKWLDELPPFQGGGDMVATVSFEKTTFNSLPFKFEAGTTNYIGAAGMAEALKYVSGKGLENIAAHEKFLLGYGTSRLKELGYITIFGNSTGKSSVISFNIDGVHPYDAGMIIDKFALINHAQFFLFLITKTPQKQ